MKGRQTEWLPFGVVVLALGVLYVWTLQATINGSNSAYTKDSGEIQVALNLAGTIHYSGYPLYTILSTGVTKLLAAIGVRPAAAASVTSLLWTLVSFVPLYALLRRLRLGGRWGAATTLLLLGVIETIWLHSVVAEVYSFTLIWLNGSLWLGARLHERFTARDWYAALLMLGTGIAHHRLLVLIAPSVALFAMPALWQQLRKQPRLWLNSALALLAPFLFYLYLPWRAWNDAQWVYGDPGSWQGFWAQFTGAEALDYVLGTPQNGADLLANIQFTFNALREQLPLLILIVGTFGLMLFIYRYRKLGISYGIIAGLTMVYMFVLPGTVFPAAVLLPTIVGLLIGWATVTSLLPDERLAVGATLLVAGWVAYGNLDVVRPIVDAPNGVEIVETLARLDQFSAEKVTVAIPWGVDYFAAAYGRHVSAELPPFTLVDHNANFRQIVDSEGRVMTLTYNLGIWHYDWWRERLDDVHYATAAPGVVVVSQTPQFQTVPATNDFDLGNGFRIRHAQLVERGDQIQVVIYWEKMDGAEDVPYSVAIHALRQNPPQSSDDLLQQADAANPVGGWYPTTLWQSGEIVRDDYLLEFSADVRPTVVRVGMYRQNADGEFVNSNWLLLPLD